MPLMLSEQKAASEVELVEKVLAHVERYKITLLHIVKRLFIPVYIEPDHKKALEKARALLEALVSQGKLSRIEGRSAFAKNAYVLPGHSVKEDADLSRLWFCCGMRKRRHLCKFSEIRPIFEAEENTKPPFHNFSVAIEDAEGGQVFLRIYLCLAEKRNAKDMLTQAIGSKAKDFRQFITDGSYGVSCLVQSEQKKREILKLLSVSHAGKPSLQSQGRFVVETVPTIQTLSAVLKQHEKEMWL